MKPVAFRSDKGLYLPGNGWFRWSFPRPGLFSGAKLFYKISLGISTTFRGHRCYLQICFPRQHSPFPITIFVQTRAVKLQGLYWFSPNPTIPGSSEIVCNKLVPTNHKKKTKKSNPWKAEKPMIYHLKSRWRTSHSSWFITAPLTNRHLLGLARLAIDPFTKRCS